MWSSYHASRSDTVGSPGKCTEALLPLFREKAVTPVMIGNGMKIVAIITHYLNLHQTPVLVVDQPLFALAKQVQ